MPPQQLPLSDDSDQRRAAEGIVIKLTDRPGAVPAAASAVG
jgi:hypothetical protein